MERENEEIRYFVNRHPMPSPDDEDGEQWWFQIIHKMKNDEGKNPVKIFSFLRFDIIKRMYENIKDKVAIVDCGKELSRDGKFNAMATNHTLLTLAIDKLSDAEKHCLTQERLMEFWWDGIGDWRALSFITIKVIKIS